MKTLTAFASFALLAIASPASAQTDDATDFDDAEFEDPGDAFDDDAPGPQPEAMSMQTGEAGPPPGALGVGLGFSPAATPAVFVDYPLNDSLVIHGGPTFQFTSFSGESGFAGNVDGSFVEFGLAAYGVYKWRELGDIAVGFIGGLEFAYSSFDVDMVGDASGIDFRLAGGLKLDYYLLPSLSIYANTGLVIGLLGDASTARAFGARAPNIGSDTSSFTIAVGGNVRTMFGMTWWM